MKKVRPAVRRLLAAALILCLLAASAPGALAMTSEEARHGDHHDGYYYSGCFHDVPAGCYYEDAVAWGMNAGVTSGVGSGNFGSASYCKRCEVVTFLWKAAGEPEPWNTVNPFVDIKPGDYYYKAVLWAVEEGVTSGVGDGRFGPNEYCRRNQIVTFLWNYKCCPDPKTYYSFTDVPYSSWYNDPVCWAKENGITSGVGGGRFGSGDYCRRRDVLTFLWKAETQLQHDLTPARDNDSTGFAPVEWSWKAEGTEGYGLPYFTSGKYVRRDGRAVLYIESSTTGEGFEYQLFAMAEGAHQDHWYDPSDDSYDTYSAALYTQNDRASSGWAYFADNGHHVIKVKTDLLEEMYIFYGNPDGEYVLVREKK